MLLIGSCQKEDGPIPPSELIMAARERPEGGVSVSEDNHLIFDSREAILDYIGFIMNSKHEDVQGYLNELGFNSPGAEKYSEYGEMPVDFEEAVDYVLNENYVFEVDDILLKLTNNGTYLLALTRDYYNNETYERFNAGEFDEESMDLIGDEPLDYDLGFIEYIHANPIRQTISASEGVVLLGRKYRPTRNKSCCIGGQLVIWRYYDKKFLFFTTGHGGKLKM